MSIAQPEAKIELAMERPLFTPAFKSLIANIELQAGDDDIDAAALYTQIVVDNPAHPPGTASARTNHAARTD